MKRVAGFFHRFAWSTVIALATAFAAVVPFDGHRRLAQAVTLLDWPISIVGKVLPVSWRGIQVAIPADNSRGIGPDVFRLAINQIALCGAIYTPIFYVPNILVWSVRRRRVRNG